MSGFDDLFDGGLDSKMDFLKEREASSSREEGMYKIDFKKVQDISKGYRSVLRFLPNFSKEGALGQSAVEKISHYVNIPNQKELSGVFDSPINFKEECQLSKLYYTMTGTKNAVMVEKAKNLKFSKKYFSYVLVVEDNQQPELVGKILIFQYGKQIHEKIKQEQDGEITGESCNVFSLEEGKDFVLIAKQIKTGNDTYPDYANCTFKSNRTSLPIYKDGKFKNVPLNENNKIDQKYRGMVKDFLLERNVNIEDYSPKRLTEEQKTKIENICEFLTTGKFNNSSSNGGFEVNQAPSASDFSFDDEEETSTSQPVATTSVDDDDFFNDLN